MLYKHILLLSLLLNNLALKLTVKGKGVDVAVFHAIDSY